jgi:hypothetical protein
MENLNSLSLVELDQEEMVNTDGGGWLADGVHYLKCNWEEMMIEHGRHMYETGSPGGAK